MKCEKCGGRLEAVAFNCDLEDGTEIWDCFCENCGHVILGFDKNIKISDVIKVLWKCEGIFEVLNNEDGYNALRILTNKLSEFEGYDVKDLVIGGYVNEN